MNAKKENDKKTILIVEDEPSLSSALERKLSQAGFNVLLARDGQSGLDVALKNHPDLILLDIIMPIMDGITMLKMLREDDWGKDSDIIILTNLSDKEDVVDEMIQSPSDYLVKTDWAIEDLVKKSMDRLGVKK